MNDLKQLDKERLSEIINEFQGKIFQSEAQFQFDLAWLLKEKYNCDVKLEDMRMVVRRNEKVIQKFYTDIVVEQGDYSVAIELKYKTAEYNGDDVDLLDHSAVDLGRYDYLWDVFRIELLVNKQKGNIPNINDNNCQLKVKECNKGFAVLLTNEKKYWKGDSLDNKNHKPIDYQFHIGEDANTLYGKKLDWKKDYKGNYPSTVFPKNGKPTFRAQPIILNEAYSYKWNDYRKALPTEQKNGDFRFVIIEI